MKMGRKFKVVVDGKEYTVEIEELTEEKGTMAPVVQQQSYEIKEPKEERRSSAPEGSVLAPMPGKILDVRVKQGDEVKAGDVLAILEAMKMENEIVAPKDGIVKEIKVKPGDSVERGAVIIVIG